MASTSTATSGASTSYTSDHDVFINYRGSDVKNTFASHLYHRLVSTGLRVFLDKPELVEGQAITYQIETAIQSASIHIAIFSPNYAQSNWCLDELILMKSSGATILPVFYKVKPYQLRWTGKNADGPYAQALRNHEEKQRYDLETIQKWRNALSAVADIVGFELDAFNGDEGLLLEKVVHRVLAGTVNKTPLQYVAKHPTGLKEKLQEFESSVLLHQKATVVKVVGIVGPGGVGKTTLAKELFNSKRSDYNRACFLPDIRENAYKGSLMSLQEKLLHDLTPKTLAPKEMKFCNIDEGREKLREHLVSVSALVILDDVDSDSQVDAFLPIKDVLRSNSLILVTSRDKKVLSCSGVLESAIYKLKGMNEFYSRELFCRYAFSQPYQLPEFADLVERFLIACDGLPLSLKVFGSLVFGEDNRSYWQGILDRLDKTLPHEILERLKISYDSLNPKEQEVFLDIACFLLKEDMDTVGRLYELIELRNLENKCLFEVDSENRVKMHDHIRDLARHIQEGLLSRRICHQYSTNNAVDLLDRLSHVITEVRGIVTVSRLDALDSMMSSDMPWHMMSSDMPWYKRFSNGVFLNRRRHLINHSRGILNLQLVATEAGYLERILSRARSPHLIWLRWFKCPYTALPSWIPMKDLKVLEIAGQKLKTLWQRDSRGPVKLRELNIWAPLSGIPKSIGQLKHLEKIVISDALFTTLPDEFCDLCSLLYLELKGCSKMKSLPDSMGKLTGLQYIDLNHAVLLQSLPSSFGNLSRLRHLSLTYCSNLTISSGTLGNISTLQYLDLSYCSNVKELPPQVANQRSLENLFLFGTNIKGLTDTKNLCQLETMHLEGNFSLEMLARLRGCLKRLKELWLSSSPELKCFPDSLGPLLTQLRVLSIEECGIEYLPQNLLEMNNLEELKVKRCPLRELPFKRIEGERETALLLNKLDSSNDKCMFGLKSLHLDGTNISELCFPQGVCPNLQYLYVYSCKELRQIEGLGGLATLQRLEIESCHKIEELHVGECHEIPEMSGVKHPMSLEELTVEGCQKLRSIQGLGQLTKLQSLNGRDCGEIEEVRGVEHVMSLKKVTVRGCPKVQWEGGVVEQLRQRLEEGFSLSDSEGEDEHVLEELRIRLKQGFSLSESEEHQYILCTAAINARRLGTSLSQLAGGPPPPPGPTEASRSPPGICDGFPQHGHESNVRQYSSSGRAS